jgi:hypothetical protein
VNMPKFFLFLVGFWWSVPLVAGVFPANPSDYLTYLPLLTPGDTLLLEAGTYEGRLNLDDLVGTAQLPIVIMGPEGSNDAIFVGNACCNTVSIERCAWLEIRNLTLDGLDIPYIDAVKAEGSSGNWAHHITLENLLVINHGGASLTVGISTKCTAWDWVIRKNTFIEPGLGMYLGNSDGTAPFINGLIEYNLIVNPRRYGLQIKHQLEGLRDIPGMTLDGKTTIRYNVIAKEENADPDTPRPNLLVGNFPASGPGENDYYEIYGNFLFENPNEGLFQGTGNIAFYNNLLVSSSPDSWAIFSFPHNGFAPRNLHIFNNTIICAGEGIDIDNPDPDFDQRVVGNAVFAELPLDIGSVPDIDNVTDDAQSAWDYVGDGGAPGLDVNPIPGQLEGSPIDFSAFTYAQDYDLDFEGYQKGWEFRGAYTQYGYPDWWPDLEIRPEVIPMLNTSLYEQMMNSTGLEVFPNPARDILQIRFHLSQRSVTTVEVFDLQGQRILVDELGVLPPGQHASTLSGLAKGVYMIRVAGENTMVIIL